MKRALMRILLVFVVLALSVQTISYAVSSDETDMTGAQIAAGYSHSMVLMPDGRLFTFGSNTFGVLGNNRTNSQSPVPQEIGNEYTAISAGYEHCLAIKGDKLYSWGNNLFGQLGDGTDKDKYQPVLIGSGFTAISTQGEASYGLKGDVLYAWGENIGGRLGVNSSEFKVKTPQKVGEGFTAISAGNYHMLALKNDVLYAWGSNENGAVGLSGKSNYSSPMKIGTGYSEISAGFEYSMALKGDDLYMWGDTVIRNISKNFYMIEKSSTPVFIGSGYTAISAGSNYVLAIRNGELISYDITEPSGSIQRFGKGFTAIEASESAFALAVKDDGVYSWGDDNKYGQLGNGTTQANPIPTRIDFAASFQAVQTNRPASTPRPTVASTAAPRITSTPQPTSTPRPAENESNSRLNSDGTYTTIY